MGSNNRQTKLYVILGSHACRTGMLMLEHKKIPYRTVMLPTGMQSSMRVRGYPYGTVPALRIGGRRVQTNVAIARFLDELQPDPPLFPGDEQHRREVEQAERWADEELQMFVRRTVLAVALHGSDGLANRGADGRLGPLLWHHDRARLIGTRMVGRFIFNVNERTERELLEQVPAMLDRIDAWIDGGVLNGERLYAADYAIASSLALLHYRLDLRPEIESRSAIALIDRVLPERSGPREPAVATP
ncbi:MAG: glutathione S-transferase family protein [Solirubrobacterales bacterium]